MLKDVLVNLLLSVGYRIVKTDMRPTPLIYYTSAEIRKLEEDLDALKSNQDIAPWNSRLAVRRYLTNQRINFYHEILNVCAQHKIDLSGKSVLDIGTCTGYLLRLIAEKYASCRLYGIDIQSRHVHLASLLVPEATIDKTDILAAPYPTPCDVIFCTEVLEHILDVDRVMANLCGSVSPGGVIAVTVPNGRYDHGSAGRRINDGASYSGHINFWSPENWGFFLRKNTGKAHVKTGLFGGNAYLYALIWP